MSETAEEKKHAPSQKHLQTLRRSGDIPHAHEFSGAVSYVVSLLLLVVVFGPLLHRLLWSEIERSLDISTVQPRNGNFITLPSLDVLFVACGLPLVGGVVHLCTTIVDSGGFVFSLKKLAFDFKKLNPGSGLGERFGLSFWTELVRSWVKFIFFAAAAVTLVMRHANEIIWSVTCGIDCVSAVGVELLKEFLFLAALIQAVSGLGDLRLSRLLHTNRNKMTDTAMKREQKEDFGSPETRQYRREFRDSIAEEAGKQRKVDVALLLRGRIRAIALSGASVELGPPTVLRVVDGAEVDSFIAEYRRRGIPLIDDEAAVAAIGETRQGHTIPESSFGMVADCFRRAFVTS